MEKGVMVLFYPSMLIQPHVLGGVLRGVLSRGDGQEDEKQKPSVTKISQRKESWLGWR